MSHELSFISLLRYKYHRTLHFPVVILQYGNQPS